MQLDPSLAFIRQKLLKKLKNLIPEFEASATALSSDGLSHDDLTSLRILVHQIAGSARTFGFAEASELAVRAEDLVDVLLGEKDAGAANKTEVEAEAASALRNLISHSATLISAELSAEPVQRPAKKTRKAKTGKKRASHKILICDDDALMGDLIRQSFTRNGCAVVEVTDGTKVLEQVRRHKPDLIIQDVNMPNISGFEILEALKSEQDIASIPVLMLTRRTEDHAVIRGISGGAVDYIFKPFEVAALVEQVQRILSRSKTTILVADDDALVRELVSMRFHKLGWSVTKAKNGREALEKFKRHKPDLVTLDLMMPGIEGTTVLSKIKSGRHHETPVVIVSALNQAENIIAGFDAGAHDYVIKPFNLDELVARTSAILERRSASNVKVA